MHTSTLFEKRRTRRDLVTDLDEMVEIELPFPAGTTLIRPLVDKTKTGFAFRMSPGEGAFLPNTPLRVTRLGKASEPQALLGRICHTTLTENDRFGLCQNIGVELLASGQSSAAFGKDRFVFEKTVYLTDTNALGNAYFARYFDWQGMAREEFLRRLLPDPAAFFGAGMKIFTVKAETEYKSGLALYDELQIEIRTTNIKKTSFEFIFFLRRKLDGLVAALGRQRFCVIGASGEFTIIPPVMKDNLLKYRMPKSI